MIDSSDFYNFESKDINGQSLVHLIGLYLPKNSIGVELGLWCAQTSCLIAQKCSNVAKIYGVDFYVPAMNTIENIFIGKKEIEYAKSLAIHNIEFSGVSEKIEIIEDFSLNAVNNFNDNSLDFVFWDCPTTYDAVVLDLDAWYKKLKDGGIMSGHDWHLIKDIVISFKNTVVSKSEIIVNDNVWAWIK